MKYNRPIYLDNAATTYPKPDIVLRAVTMCMTHSGGNPGRGSHALAMAAAEEIYRCREVAADFFGAPAPEQVIFTLNTTHALNLAVKGILRPGDHVLCSDMEHNSVWRPLYRLQKEGLITLDVFDTFPTAPIRTDDMILSSLASHITPRTRLVICAHASNICSASLPIGKIGALCRARGILFAVDAAQSAGVLPIDMEAMHIDALCVPGHKGLYGPQGTGMLLLSQGLTLNTLMEGGNGMDSLRGEMSTDTPERYEPGTLQTPAIAGLREGISFVAAEGTDSIRRHETELYVRARDALLNIPGVIVWAPDHEGSVLLFTVEQTDSEAVGRVLDENHICVRPGFHCSALGHHTLGTPTGGAVRASFGYHNRKSDVDALVDTVYRMARGR